MINVYKKEEEEEEKLMRTGNLFEELSDKLRTSQLESGLKSDTS